MTERRPIVTLSCIVRNGDNLLLGKQKGNSRAGKYCFPGGKVEYETLEACFWRELREETGLMPGINHPKRVGFAHDLTRERNTLILYMLIDYEKFMGIPKGLEPEYCETWEFINPLTLKVNHQSNRLKLWLYREGAKP